MDVWDLETKKNDCSLSIDNPGFCRLAKFTTSEGGMLKMAQCHIFFTIKITLYIATSASKSLNSDCFAVAHSEIGKVRGLL